MGRKANLINAAAIQAAKDITRKAKERGRGSALSALTTQLTNIPRTPDSKGDPSPEEILTWHQMLLTALDGRFKDHRWMPVEALRILTANASYESGDWFARQRLKGVGAQINTNVRTSAQAMMQQAIDWQALDAEELMAMSGLYAARAHAAVGVLEPQRKFDLDITNFVVARMAYNSAPQSTTASMALIDATLTLPHTRMNRRVNLSMLQVAFDRSAELLAKARKKNRKGKETEQLFLLHLRAGTHFASHLMANGRLDDGRSHFNALSDMAATGVNDFDGSIDMHHARLRLLHKAYKYEKATGDDEPQGPADKAYIAFGQALKRAKSDVGSPYLITLRQAKFERDTDFNDGAYRLIAEAIAKRPRDPYPQSVLRGWLMQDNFPAEYAELQASLLPDRPAGEAPAQAAHRRRRRVGRVLTRQGG